MVFGGVPMATDGDKSGDFYAVLGLKKECSEAELRNAYKKLALRWHPDRCSASGNSKFVEEAKEKFQEIQEAYAVLSDSNKRFLYDFGIYDSDDDDNNGMGDFLGEMAQMMSQTKPSENGHESFEELQKLFVEMFHADLKNVGVGGPVRLQPRNESPAANGHSRSSSSSSSTTSATVSDSTPSCNAGNGGNKRGSWGLSMGAVRLDDLGAGSSGFCFGVGPLQSSPGVILSLLNSEDEIFTTSETLNNKAESSKARGGINGGGGSRRRSGRKQKVSSKHDVSSRDAEISI